MMLFAWKLSRYVFQQHFSWVKKLPQCLCVGSYQPRYVCITVQGIFQQTFLSGKGSRGVSTQVIRSAMCILACYLYKITGICFQQLFPLRIESYHGFCT